MLLFFALDGKDTRHRFPSTLRDGPVFSYGLLTYLWVDI